MKKITSIIIIALISVSLYGQESHTDISVSEDEAKNAAYFGIIRQGALFAKYERRILLANWTNTIFNIGLGSLPGEFESGIPRTLKIMSEIAQTIGYKNFF